MILQFPYKFLRHERQFKFHSLPCYICTEEEPYAWIVERNKILTRIFTLGRFELWKCKNCKKYYIANRYSFQIYTVN